MSTSQRQPSSPGAFRRSMLWGFWFTAVVVVVITVDAVMRRDWVALAAPGILVVAMVGLKRSHDHQRALQDLAPADGEDSWRRRAAAKRHHERAELVWGLTALGAFVAAIIVPGLLR